MSIKIPVGVAGLFHNVEVLRADGSVKYETGEFKNLVLDQGLTRMVQFGTNNVTPPDCFSVCSVGTGNTPPSTGQTQLDNQVAIASTSGSPTGAGHNYEDGYIWARYTYTFALGAINNQNIAELGIGWGGGTSLFSRALIRDTEGNPTSITILSDEQLRVTWEHRRYWPQEDITGSIVNEGNKGGVYNYTVRPSRVSTWSIGPAVASGIVIMNYSSSTYSNSSPGIFDGTSELGEINDRPSGSGVNYANMQTRIAPDGNKARGRISLGLTQGNLAGGIGALVFGKANNAWFANNTGMEFQMAFDPPIPKTSEDLLEIDVFIEPFRV